MINFAGSVKKNHGIKEKNLLKLLLPVGVEADSLDQTWLATMNSFGERRGEAAHRSTGSHRATQQVNPKDELKIVKSLIRDGLKVIDRTIDSLIINT